MAWIGPTLAIQKGATLLTLHHLNESRSQRIFWLLELSELDYDVRVYWRDPKTHLAPPPLKQVHPLGTSPVLTEGEYTIAESGAICEYIGRKSSAALFPEKGTKDEIDVQFWSHYAEGSFMPPLVTAMVIGKAREKVPWPFKPIVNKVLDAIMDAYFNKVIARNFAFVEDHLAGRTWLVGDSPTVADVQMSFGMEAVYDNGRLTDRPNMSAYVERLRDTASYQRAMERRKREEQQN